MKKQVSALSLIILCILGISFISAAGAEIKPDKSEYYPNEFLRAEILGSFPDGLKLENIAIYEGEQVHATPAESELLKLSTKYLYYAVLPSANGTYYIKIKDTKYYVGQETSEEQIIANFTIANTDKPYLSISRGFISATKDFSVNVKSLNAVQEVVAKFEATGEEKTVTIGQNSEKTLSFSTSGISKYTESSLKINDYSLLVFVSPAGAGAEPFVNGTAAGPGGEENTTDTEPEPELIPIEKATPEQIQNCEDINGKLCKKSEKCENSNTAFAKGVACCMSACVPKPKSWAWIGGIVILVILAAGGWWFYTKSKKAAAPKSEEEEFDARAKKYNLRMFSNLKPEPEVHKSLKRE